MFAGDLQAGQKTPFPAPTANLVARDFLDTGRFGGRTTRMPGRSSGVPTNSIPAASRADLRRPRSTDCVELAGALNEAERWKETGFDPVSIVKLWEQTRLGNRTESLTSRHQTAYIMMHADDLNTR